MKSSIVSLIVMISSLFILNACEVSARDIQNYQATFVTMTDNDGLEQMESRIQAAFYQSFIQQNPDELDKIVSELENMPTNTWSDYWLAYAKFRKAVFHIAQNDTEQSESISKDALETVANIKEKTSEHYALQAMIHSFTIQFMRGIQAGVASQKVSSLLKKAKKLDDKNLRVYFVMGNQDFYTPEQYGGGKKVEEFLTQAIALDHQYNDNPILPTWGKDEAYELLLEFYIKNEEYEKAKTLFQEASTAYPNSYRLMQMGTKLVGK
ncbi:MAG: hypothetical protein AAFO82_02695 [Bacteroidota bacterium]